MELLPKSIFSITPWFRWFQTRCLDYFAKFAILYGKPVLWRESTSWKTITVVVFQEVDLQNNCFHVDFLRKTVFGLYTLFIKIMAWLQGVKKARHDLHLDTSKSRSVRVEWRFYEEKKINLIWNRFSHFSRSQLFFLPACYSFFLATPGMFGVKHVRGVNLFFIFGFFSRHDECRPNKP